MADAFGLRRLRSLPVQAGWRIPALSVLTTFLTLQFLDHARWRWIFDPAVTLRRVG